MVGGESRPDAGVVTSMTASTTSTRLRRGLAVLLVLVGLGVLLLWRGTADVAVTASLEAAHRGSSGGLTLAAHPDPWFVYTEDGDGVTSVAVTRADGSTLPVTLMSHTFTYGPHREGRQVARFEVPAGAGAPEVHVVVTPAGAQGEVPVAVTTFDEAGLEPFVLWGGGALLLVNAAGAVALALSPGPRPRTR